MSLRHDPVNHYTVLGVDRTASPEEIKAAFRARAKALHPDTNQRSDSSVEFHRIREAYAVLGSPDQRRRYDFFTPAVAPAPPPRATAAPPQPVRPPGRRRMLVSLAVPVVLLALLGYWLFPESDEPLLAPSPARADVRAGLADFEREMQVTMQQSAPTFSVTAPPATEVEVAGRDGHVFVISGQADRRLKPILERLSLEYEQLQEQKAAMNTRRQNLEQEHRSMDASDPTARVALNIKVDAFNREAAALLRAIEWHTREVNEYFDEVDRAGVRVR